MKLFRKAFLIFFFPPVIVVVILALLFGNYHIIDSEKALIEHKEIFGNIIATQIVAGHLQNSWPFENLSQLSKEKDFLFWWVVDEEGLIYRADNPDFMGTEAFSYFPEIESKKKVDEYTYINKDRGYGIYVKKLKAGDEERYFWLGFSLNSIFEKKDFIVASVLEASVLISFFLIVLIYYSAIYLTRPLSKLKKAAMEISAGNLDMTADIKTKDEVGDLAKTFNSMAGSIKKQKSELEDYYKNLEGKVQERTSDLKEKNDELESFNNLTVNRELKMIELKDRVKELEKRLDEQNKSS